MKNKVFANSEEACAFLYELSKRASKERGLFRTQQGENYMLLHYGVIDDEKDIPEDQKNAGFWVIEDGNVCADTPDHILIYKNQDTFDQFKNKLEVKDGKLIVEDISDKLELELYLKEDIEA